MQAATLILGIAIGIAGALALAVPPISLLLLRPMLVRIVRGEVDRAHADLLGDLAAVVRSVHTEAKADAELLNRLGDAFERPRHLRAVTDTHAG